MDPTAFIQNTVIPSAEYQSKNPGVFTIPEAQTGQTLQVGTNQLTGAINEAQKAFTPVMQAQNQLTQQQFDTLKQNIATQKKQAEEGVRTTLASRGVLDSSELGRDTAQIEQIAQQQLGQADYSQVLQQAEANLQNTQNIFGMASQTQQTLFNQQQGAQAQAFQQVLQTHQQQLADFGIPVSNLNNVASLVEGFLNSGTDIASAYPELWQSISDSVNRLDTVATGQ